jgi:2-aminoadipate transaminase
VSAPATDPIALFSKQSEIERVFLSAVTPPAEGLIRFGGGLPDPSTYPREILAGLLDEIVREGPVDLLSYDLGGGESHLRSVIADRMVQRGVEGVTARQILTTNGSAGAITLAARALLDAGDVIVAEELSYPGSLRAFELIGAEVVTTPIDHDGLRTDELERTLADLARQGRRVKGIYTISTFHNPTGTVLSEQRRTELVEIARRENLVILQDDTYGELCFDAHRATPLLALAPERTIHLGSFSKVIAPGLRVGWAAASAPIIRALSNVRTDLGAQAVVQRVVAEYIGRGHLDAHVAEVCELYRHKRDLLLAGLDEWCASSCTWDVPTGAFFVWMVPRQPIDVAALHTKALEVGTTFLAASYFRAPDPNVGFRLSYGELPAGDLAEGARRIGEALVSATSS